MIDSSKESLGEVEYEYKQLAARSRSSSLAEKFATAHKSVQNKKVPN